MNFFSCRIRMVQHSPLPLDHTAFVTIILHFMIMLVKLGSFCIDFKKVVLRERKLAARLGQSPPDVGK